MCNNLGMGIRLVDRFMDLLDDPELFDNFNSFKKCGLNPSSNEGLHSFFQYLIRLVYEGSSSESLDKIIKGISIYSALKASILELFGNIVISRSIDPVPLLALMSALEGDGNDKKWVLSTIESINNAEVEKDLDWLYKIVGVTRGSVVLRVRQTKIPLYKCGMSLSFLHKAATNAIVKLFGENQKVDSTQLDTSDRKTILFVVSRPFPKSDNTHFNVLLNVGKTIKSSGSDVSLKFLIADEDSIVTPWGQFGVYERGKLKFHRRRWSEVEKDNESLYPLNDNLIFPNYQVQRLAQISDWVDSIKPTVMLFLSGVYDSFFLRSYFFGRYSITIIPTSVNFIPEHKFYNNILSTKETYFDSLVRAGISENCIIKVPAVVDVFQNNDDYTPFFLSGCEDDFLVGTVLGGGRISKFFSELTAHELKKVEEFFLNVPNFRWILVGECDFDSIVERSLVLKEMALSDRLISIQFVKEIRGFFRCIDAAFNIPGATGGGQGTAAAINEGLPALSGRHSDPAGYIPKECLFNDLDDALALLRQMATDKSFRSLMADLCTRSLEKFSPKNVATAWRKAFSI
jgi:hypothetical protein